jgi:hypothetical protein
MFHKILNFFRSIKDYRVQGRIDYKLEHILFIVLVGTLADCHGWKEIHNFAQCNAKWFKEKLFKAKLDELETELEMSRQN